MRRTVLVAALPAAGAVRGGTLASARPAPRRAALSRRLPVPADGPGDRRAPHADDDPRPGGRHLRAEPRRRREASLPPLRRIGARAGRPLAGRGQDRHRGRRGVRRPRGAPHARLGDRPWAGLRRARSLLASPSLGFWSGFSGPDPLAQALGLAPRSPSSTAAHARGHACRARDRRAPRARAALARRRAPSRRRANRTMREDCDMGRPRPHQRGARVRAATPSSRPARLAARLARADQRCSRSRLCAPSPSTFATPRSRRSGVAALVVLIVRGRRALARRLAAPGPRPSRASSCSCATADGALQRSWCSAAHSSSGPCTWSRTRCSSATSPCSCLRRRCSWALRWPPAPASPCSRGRSPRSRGRIRPLEPIPGSRDYDVFPGRGRLAGSCGGNEPLVTAAPDAYGFWLPEHAVRGCGPACAARSCSIRPSASMSRV